MCCHDCKPLSTLKVVTEPILGPFYTQRILFCLTAKFLDASQCSTNEMYWLQTFSRLLCETCLQPFIV